MTLPRPHTHSPYMEFSKLHSGARFNLATSGIMSYPLADLDFRVEDLEINGPTIYGYRPLLEAIGALKGVPAECVVHAAGTSMANHLALSALLAPGDEVLIEEPTYELILSTARYLGAKVRRFQRRFENDYELDPDEVAACLTPNTRLIIVTNMHNPSSSLGSTEALRAIGSLAETIGARVLVDEVYLELLRDLEVSTALQLGRQFVVTSSLTKAYGLSGLRCGWILAEPGLAKEMWQLNDLFAANHVHIAERLSVSALQQIDKIAARADQILNTNRKALLAALEGHPAIDLTIPEIGTTVFPRLRQGDVLGFCRFLREKYETSVVPGSFFESPQHFRVGIPGDVEMTQHGLSRLAEALHAWQS